MAVLGRSGYVLLIFPPAFDMSAWYAANALLAVAVLIAIALYAFHVATRGKWLPA